MDQDSDKREYKRISRHFILRFRAHQDDGQKGGWEVVTVDDLSAGGALINFEKELEIGSVLDITITVPLVNEPIRCLAKVLRVQKPANALICRIAVAFLELSEKDREIMKTLAAKINQ
jgi:c-di-GMP-binding flagellar brake protein YcgR